MEVLESKAGGRDLVDSYNLNDHMSASIQTAQMIQNKFNEHFQHADISTLADALKVTRNCLDPALSRDLRELNTAASTNAFTVGKSTTAFSLVSTSFFHLLLVTRCHAS